MQDLRIVVVDDHPGMRRALRALFESVGWQVVGEASNGREGVNETERLRPDLVTMDINMPELNGIEATRELTRSTPASSVVILTQDYGTTMEHQAFEAGARAYLPKTDATRIVDAVRTVTQLRNSVSA